MKITLGVRTAETAALYFEKTRSPSIRKTLPQKAQTADEAVADFYDTQKPGASSFGRTILADGRYVGDVWCYCIDPDDTPNAMVSCYVFEQDLWNLDVASTSLGLFLGEIGPKFGLKTVGAFTFADNLPSIRVLEKNGFRMMEEFAEGGVLSRYYQRNL